MSKLNLQIGLNSYADKVETNQNLLNHFKWLRSVSGVLVNNPESAEFLIPAGGSLALFDGTVALFQDASTEYTISMVAAGIYKLQWNGVGGNPTFRAERPLGLDNTSEVTITKNGSLMTASFTNGTLPDLSAVVPGDEIRIVDIGVYKILSKTPTSVSWENEAGTETVFTLTSGSDLRIYSASGVQKGQKISIKSGFSPATYGDYQITDVAPDFLIFNSVKTLPEESDINCNITIYKSEKKIVFLESSGTVTVRINEVEDVTVAPLISSSGNNPGMLLLPAPVHSAEILNPSLEEVTIYYISAE